MTLEENALALLLRSPHLAIGTIMELLDLSDREFREIVNRNNDIAKLLDTRRAGELEPAAAEPRQCAACDEWFVPYAGARCCSDACAKQCQITKKQRGKICES